MMDADLAVKLSKLVHDHCKDAPHDIGIMLAQVVAKHQKDEDSYLETMADQLIKSQIATGETEAAAVCALFRRLEFRKTPQHTNDVRKIFEKNSSFSHEKN